MGHGLLIHEVSRSHTKTHHCRLDSSGRVISSSQRPLPDNTNNTHNRQASTLPVGFEPTISAGERPKTYALDHAANGTGPIEQVSDFIYLRYFTSDYTSDLVDKLETY